MAALTEPNITSTQRATVVHCRLVSIMATKRLQSYDTEVHMALAVTSEVSFIMISVRTADKGHERVSVKRLFSC